MTAQQALLEKIEELREFMSLEWPFSVTVGRAVIVLRGSYPIAELVLHGS
jgi:hypothetical protein